MQLAEVRRKAFAMPLNDPAYPPGPYKFYNREFVVISYRSDIDRLLAHHPERLCHVRPAASAAENSHGC